MYVGSPTAGTSSSSQWRPDNEFETDRVDFVYRCLGSLHRYDFVLKPERQLRELEHCLVTGTCGNALLRLATLAAWLSVDREGRFAALGHAVHGH
jgi:hypothetical protein